MYEDTLLKELYDYREQLAAKFDYDIHQICEYLNQQDSSLVLSKFLDVSPTKQVYPLCLKLDGLDRLVDRSELCQELCTLSYTTIDPQFQTLEIPENVDNPAKLISKLLILRKMFQKPYLVLIFYGADPTLELLEICDRLHHYFPLIWISDRSQPYPAFSPGQENLSLAIQSWLDSFHSLSLHL
ncbi:MAG: hypothetical protein ACO3NK_15210 [Prochlorotrichaceae cyanobacterium]|jgi:hypothetical protein